MQGFGRVLVDESGVTAIEYGLIVSLIILVCVGVLSSVGGNLTNTFTTVANNM